MVKPLDDILAYKNAYLLDKFLHHYPGISRIEAEEILADLIRFLWLTDKMDQQRLTDPDTPDITIADGTYILDMIWHEFVLLTKMYTDFCDTYFGRYLHHPPDLHKYPQHLKTMPPEKAMEILITELVTITLEELGEATAVRWFDQYLKYLPEDAAEQMAHHTAGE